MNKRGAIFILFLSFFWISSVSAQTSPPKKDKPGTAIFVMAIPTELQVETKSYYYTADNIHITMKWPKIQGLTDKKFQNQLNRYFEKQSHQAKKQLMQARKTEKFVETSFELVREYTVKESIPDYFTISIFEYTYTGGVCGISNQKYVVIDLKNNRILTQQDLLEEK